MSEFEKNQQALPDPWSNDKYAGGSFVISEEGDGVKRWVFKKNCSLTPQQLVGWYLSLCVITGSIAVGFWIAGFWIVLPFAGLELLLVGVAFLFYARHAADKECVIVGPKELTVELHLGSKVFKKSMSTQWARLEYDGRFKAPLVIKCGRDEIAVGRFIAEVDKPAMHRDLRAWLVKSNSAVIAAST